MGMSDLIEARISFFKTVSLAIGIFFHPSFVCMTFFPPYLNMLFVRLTEPSPLQKSKRPLVKGSLHSYRRITLNRRI